MSLVTNPRGIIIESDELFDVRSDASTYSGGERIFDAFCNARGVRDRPEKDKVSMKARLSLPSREASKPRKQQQKQEWQWQPKKPRRFDPKAVERLNTPTVASRARSQRKYVDMLEATQKQERSTTPRCVSPVATKAGLRLYSAAVAMQKRLDKMRAEQEKVKKQKEENFSFRPQITSLAKTIGRDGYRPPHERYDHVKEKLAKSFLLRERERIDRMTTGCTFHPTLTAASTKMIRMRRSNEPFDDAGERLFYEGGHRLIRQQLRERILEQKAENNVIGAFQITPRAAENLASRLMKWKETANSNREAARQEYIRNATQSFTSKVVRSQQGQQNYHNHNHNQRCGQPLPTDTKTTRRVPEDELRLIRCRALFHKYASSDTCESIRLQDVKRQVQDLFPEDSGVVAALASSFSNTEEISKAAFVDCLLRFQNLHGSQLWGDPRNDDVPSAVGKSSLRFLPSPTCGPQESVMGKKQALMRSSSAHTISSGRKDHVSSHLPLYHRSSSTVCGRLSKDDPRCSGNYMTHTRQEVRSVGQLFGGRSVDLCTKKKVYQPLEEHKTRPRQEDDEKTVVKQRSLSPDSVEVSSLTEDNCDTPNAKRPEDIVAELEALLATPVERSVTASPKQRSDRHIVKVNEGVSCAVPPSLRRRVRKVNVPSYVGGASCSATRKGCVNYRQLLQEVELVLNAKDIHVEIDRNMASHHGLK